MTEPKIKKENFKTRLLNWFKYFDLEKKKKTTEYTFYVLLFLIVSFLIIDISNLCPDKICNLSLSNLKEGKGFFYIIFGFFLSISIFYNQKVYGDLQNRDHKEKLDELDAVQETKDKTEKLALTWFDETTEVILFYFPNSFVPGFWNDNGNFFELSLIKKLEKITQKDNKKIFFIGSSADEESQFQYIVNQILNKKNLSYFNESHWIEYFNGELGDDIENITKGLIQSYKGLITTFETKTVHKKDFITSMLKNNTNYWKNKPNYSFVLRKMKNDKLEMLIIDTFNVLNEPQKVYEIMDSSNFVDENNVGILFDTPTNYIIRNNNSVKLLISTLFQTSFSEEKEIAKLFLN